MSLTLSGTCAGYRMEAKMNNITEHVIGIVTPVNNGFPGQTEVVQVRLDKRHVDANMGPQFQALQGKEISVPVYVKVWKSKANNVGFELHLSGEGKPISMPQPKAAAV